MKFKFQSKEEGCKSFHIHICCLSGKQVNFVWESLLSCDISWKTRGDEYGPFSWLYTGRNIIG